jgi:2,3,4,5-tetrahydropyridine-2,6-dicarboxylate N-succinyltransferase
VSLSGRIESAFERASDGSVRPEDRAAFDAFMTELNAGRVRAAEKTDGRWTVHAWVKKGILLGFRIGAMTDYSADGRFVFYDKDTFPPKSLGIGDGVRIVPGGSAIRSGAYIGRNVTCMPPMYVNVGAYVDDGTMIDSHALVGSCAQIGKRVHISAGSQIGGVLEPVGSLPVIVEDDALIGGNCGIYEGTVVGAGAVIGAGTVITGSTPVVDLVGDRVLSRSGDGPLVIPPNAVIIPGTRPIQAGIGRERGLSVCTPILVKYRDDKTERSVRLEDILRGPA